MQAAQADAKLAELPISDEALFAIANCAMLGNDEYADGTKAWNKSRPNKRTWAN